MLLICSICKANCSREQEREKAKFLNGTWDVITSLSSYVPLFPTPPSLLTKQAPQGVGEEHDVVPLLLFF